MLVELGHAVEKIGVEALVAEEGALRRVDRDAMLRKLALQPGDLALVDGDLALDLGDASLVFELVVLRNGVGDGARDADQRRHDHDRCDALLLFPRRHGFHDRPRRAGEHVEALSQQAAMVVDGADLLVDLGNAEGRIGLSHIEHRQIVGFPVLLKLHVHLLLDGGFGQGEEAEEAVGRGFGRCDLGRRVLLQLRVSLHRHERVPTGRGN